MLLEETVKKLSPMQSLLALKDFPHTLAYEPCGEVTLAPVLNEARGSTSGSFRWSRRSVRRSPRQICTALLSVVAFVAVTLYYFRACHGWARNGNVPRRLAGQMPSSGEDPMLSFILDMCLDMEEESGSTPQRQMAAAGHREAHLPAGHEQGPPESTSNQYPWDWDDPPFYYPSQAPHSEPAYRQVDDHGLQRGASAVWGGADVQEEEPATFSGHFPVTQPCIGMPPPAAAEEGTSGLDISMSSPHQFRPSAGSSTHACLHLSPGVDPDVKTPGLAVPIDPSVNPQQLLIGSSLPQSSLLHAPPHRAAVAQKRPFAPVESSGLLSVNNPSKRLRAENSPTLGLSDTVASQGVLLEPTVELGQRLVLRPIQAVPSEMLPHSLEHSALGRGSSSGMVNIQVASWPKKTGSQGGSAPVPGELPANSWEHIQCSLSVCTDEGTKVPAEALSGDSASQSGVSSQIQDAKHPFYRLPDLEAGARLKRFSMGAAFQFNRTLKAYEPLLQYMRSSLAKEVLSEAEANGVIQISERLVSHIYYFQRTPLIGLTPSAAVAVLGRRYLMLEALVCAAKVLGTAMEAANWWQVLVSVVPSQVVFFPSLFKDERTRAYSALAIRLSSAIDLLKRGIRPGASETVSLKQDLLCKKFCQPEFRRPPYEPWRNDDKNAGGGHDG